jgi:hypothetical protein
MQWVSNCMSPRAGANAQRQHVWQPVRNREHKRRAEYEYILIDTFDGLLKSAQGPGCVKSRLSQESTKLFSQLSSPGGGCQCNWFPYRRICDRCSTRKLNDGLFIQPGSKTEVSGLARHVRFTLRSIHRQPAPAYPFGAKNGSRVLLDHLIGGRAGGNTKKEAPLLPAGRNRDDNWMVAERKFERTDVVQCFDRLNASCWIVDPYRHARDPEMDRHAVLAAQAFAPHGQLERAVAVL